jgi:hypothetical protein
VAKKGKRPYGRQGRKWKDNIKTNVKQDEKVTTGFIWLRIGANVGFL